MLRVNTVSCWIQDKTKSSESRDLFVNSPTESRSFVNKPNSWLMIRSLSITGINFIFILRFHENAGELSNAVEVEFKSILNQVKKPVLPYFRLNKFAPRVPNGSKTENVEDAFDFDLTLTYETPVFNKEALVVTINNILRLNSDRRQPT